ncbi:aminoacyl-tRNA deacylase [Candidatus Nitrospira salsa]|nr:MAG: deacylase [Nitrospirales bacterium]
MSISNKLKEYLESQKVPYQVLPHTEVYTSLETAQSLHVPGKDLAKVTMVNVDDKLVMTVLPSTWKVDLHRLKEVFGAKDVRLASEGEFKDLFPDCEVGAMPPFGNLYGLKVYVDHSLTEDEEIVFDGGTHQEGVKMRYKDFAAHVNPVVETFHLGPSKISEGE